MNQTLVDRIVQAVLYEGYILYPYRRGTKNHQRWTFGCVFPENYSEAVRGLEPCWMQTQCLFRASAQTKLKVQVRFLQPVKRSITRSREDRSAFDPIDELEVDGKRYQNWQEAVERTVSLDVDASQTRWQTRFAFPAEQTTELVRDGKGEIAGQILRIRGAIEGAVDLEITHQAHATGCEGVYRLTVRIQNTTPIQLPANTPRDQALPHAMASTHAILSIDKGSFVSAIDPPKELADLARACRQQGAWPVLVGEPGQTDALLASPIILYDYPQIAPESPGDLFDGTEIDEILSLRIMTLTDQEKRAAADLDPKSAALLNRTEGLARHELSRLHGTMRAPRSVQAVHIGRAELRAGDRVRLRPTGRADAFDIILRGKTATITAIEQDFENRIHLAVTIDDDPGADIGQAGQIGHRFFFRPEDVEPLAEPSREVCAP